MKVPVEISARHAHISRVDFEKLYGKGKTLTFLKKLSQPEEFAARETLALVNEKSKIEGVRIVGPFRKKSEVELSLTDARILKLNPLPDIMPSGNLDKATQIVVKNPKAQLKIPVRIAQRHLHCSPEQAKKLGLKNGQKISIKIGGQREVTFHNILVRVSKEYNLSLHLDTDEANAAGIKGETFGEIVKE